MRILVLSSTPWNTDNSFGNTYSNLFEGMASDWEFANVYCSYGGLNNSLPMQGFQITAHSLIENLKNPKLPTGKRVDNNSAATQRSAGEQKNFDTARKLRWQVLFWARDLLWKLGRWKSAELMSFIDEFQPDLIMQPVYYSGYLNDIACFIKNYTGVPMLGYISDDNYTLRRFSLSPLFWIDLFLKRPKVKRTIENCELLYVVSEIQKREYEKLFTPACKILTKGADFSGDRPSYSRAGDTVCLLYAGNIGSKRWKSLSYISEAIQCLRSEGKAISLDIYTPTPLTGSMEKALCRDGTEIHPPVSYAEILELQRKADVLVHAEGLDLANRLAVHQSFSTKLVDYFSMGKCIFAVGTADIASIQHLLENDAALVAQSRNEVLPRLRELCEDEALLCKYSEKAWECGKRFHDIRPMQSMLRENIEFYGCCNQ